MTDQFNNNKPKNVLANMDEYLDRIRRGEPDVQMQKREGAYRRGWQQGWSYACEIILDCLLSNGTSLDEVYRLISRFDAELVSPWRYRIDSYGTPQFHAEDFPPEQRKDEDQEGVDDDS